MRCVDGAAGRAVHPQLVGGQVGLPEQRAARHPLVGDGDRSVTPGVEVGLHARDRGGDHGGVARQRPLNRVEHAGQRRGGRLRHPGRWPGVEDLPGRLRRRPQPRPVARRGRELQVGDGGDQREGGPHQVVAGQPGQPGAQGGGRVPERLAVADTPRARHPAQPGDAAQERGRPVVLGRRGPDQLVGHQQRRVGVRDPALEQEAVGEQRGGLADRDRPERMVGREQADRLGQPAGHRLGRAVAVDDGPQLVDQRLKQGRRPAVGRAAVPRAPEHVGDGTLDPLDSGPGRGVRGGREEHTRQ